VSATDGPPADLVWYRMHPITPALNAWKTIAALLVLVVWQVAPQLSENQGLTGGRAVLGVLAFLVVGGLIGPTPRSPGE
jgi:hypothetical protein